MKLDIPSFKLYVSIEKIILIVLSKIEINLFEVKKLGVVGGPGHYTVISWDWIPIPIPSPSPSRLTIDHQEGFGEEV